MPFIVSAYYKIPSKQTHERYLPCLQRFFRAFTGKSVLFFCSQEVYSEILLFGIDITNVKFILCEFVDLPILKKFPYLFWEKQKRLDPESYHTPELGIIWSSKKEFLNYAMDLYPTNEWFLWVDAGCIRKDEWIEPCSHLFDRATLDKGIYVQNLNPIPMDRVLFQYDGYNYWIAGGVIYAHRDYIPIYSAAYDAMLVKYDTANISATSDQYIMLSMITQKSEHYLKSINWYELSEDFRNTCPDTWFFFLSYV